VHACSEIGLGWLLFALHDMWMALGFVYVLDFCGDFVLLEHRRNGQTGIETVFDHFGNTYARYVECAVTLFEQYEDCCVGTEYVVNLQ